MKQIRVKTRTNEWTNTAYYQNFHVVEKLPEVGEESIDCKVTAVEEIPHIFLDPEQADEVYLYDYYKVTEVQEAIDEDDEPEEFVGYYAVLRKEENNMRILYYIRTNGYDMVASVDEAEEIVRFLMETEDFPVHPNEAEAEAFLHTVEDDSSWPQEIDYNDFYDEYIHSEETDAPEVLARIEKEL